MSYIPSMTVRPELREQRFVITVGSSTAPRGTYLQHSADNSNVFARFISGDENFKLMHEEGLLFTPVRVDLSGYTWTPFNLTVQGVKSDGSIVSHDFSSQGGGFVTCTFPPTFQQIRELRIPQTIYYMDNIVVEPPVGESPPPAPLPAPFLYDINWEQGPHQVGKMTSTGGQRAPSSVIFGTAVVRERPGGQGRYLELSQDVDTYDQIQLSLAVKARRYVIDFDMSLAETASTAVVLDLNIGFLRLDVSRGRVRESSYTQQLGSMTTGETTYTASTNDHFGIVWDENTHRLILDVNGQAHRIWSIVDNADVDIHAIRFSTSNTAVTALDNLRAQAMDQPQFQIAPSELDFPSIEVLQSQTIPVTLSNTGTSPLTMTGIRPLGHSFSFSGLTFPVTLGAGEEVVGQVTASPLTLGYKESVLILESTVGNAYCLLSMNPASPVTNYFSSHPLTRSFDVGSPFQVVSVFSGPSAARFEWTKDGQVIAGTGTTLNVSASASSTDAGVYQVKAYLTNGETVTSNPATIIVATAAFTSQPGSRWVRILPGFSSTFNLSCGFSVPVSRYEWTRDGVVIPFTTPTLTITSATLQDAGVYRVTAHLSDGRAYHSQPANVGVVIYTSATQKVASGADFSHVTQVAGPSLTYSWFFNQTLPVSALPGVVEAGRTLRIDQVSGAHHGSWTSTALMPDAVTPSTLLPSGSIVSLNLQVQGGTVPAPELLTTTLGHAMVGQPYDFTLSSTGGTPLTYSVSWLPAEWTLIPSTGRIFGTPLASSIPAGTPVGGSKTYYVMVTAKNIYGQVSRQVTLVIHPRLSGARVVGLTQASDLPALRRVARVQGDITLDSLSLKTLGSQSVNATAQLAFDQAAGVMKGTLRTSGKSMLEGHAIRWDGQCLESDNVDADKLFVFQAARSVRQLNPAYHVVGKYPSALTVDVESSSVPSTLPFGSGVLRARLGNNALMTYTGRLPDGSTFLGSGELVEDWKTDHGLCHPLSCATTGPGSLAGWLALGYNSLSGQLQWIRQPQRRQPTWPEGFELASVSEHVSVTGERLVAPASGDTLMGLHRQPVVLSGRSRDGLNASSRFRVSNKHFATALPPATPRDYLAIQPAEGTFSGTLRMGTYKGRALIGSYHGVLLPSQQVGRGYMLVPDLVRHEASVLGGGSAAMPMKPVEIELSLGSAE